MKRIPAILFCILFCVSFAGCSTSSGSVDSSLSLVSEFEEDRQAEAAGSSAPDTSETDNGRASESTGEATETTVPDNMYERGVYIDSPFLMLLFERMPSACRTMRYCALCPGCYEWHIQGHPCPLQRSASAWHVSSPYRADSVSKA